MMHFLKIYDEYVTKKIRRGGGDEAHRARLKMDIYSEKVATERAARLRKAAVDQKVNPPIRCNSPTSARSTAQ